MGRHGWWARTGRGLVAGLVVLVSWAALAEPRELVVLNWSDYLDPGVIADFEARCECRVREVYFENDDSRDELMVESDGAGVDVIVVNGLMLDLYRERGWLAPVPEDGLSNRHRLDERWVDAFPAAADYAVPYFWGTLGIAYRRDRVPEPITRWRDILEPAPPLQGRVVMIRSQRDLFTPALKALGFSLNATDPERVEAAGRLLEAQRPHVFSYTYVALSDESTLVTGDAYAAMMYSGDALMLREYDPNISYVLPQEGSGIWVDYLAVSPRASQPQLAWQFIDFLNEPRQAARNALYVHYATPNRDAEPLLPQAFLSDPVIYPDAEALSRCEFYRPLPPRVERRFGNLTQQVLTGAR